MDTFRTEPIETPKAMQLAETVFHKFHAIHDEKTQQVSEMTFTAPHKFGWADLVKAYHMSGVDTLLDFWFKHDRPDYGQAAFLKNIDALRTQYLTLHRDQEHREHLREETATRRAVWTGEQEQSYDEADVAKARAGLEYALRKHPEQLSKAMAIVGDADFCPKITNPYVRFSLAKASAAGIEVNNDSKPTNKNNGTRSAKVFAEPSKDEQRAFLASLTYTPKPTEEEPW